MKSSVKNGIVRATSNNQDSTDEDYWEDMPDIENKDNSEDGWLDM